MSAGNGSRAPRGRRPGRGDAVVALRTLNRPLQASVRLAPETAGARAPSSIDGTKVEMVRETWLVEDGWWTERPLRRRYWEVLTAGGRNIVVFHDLCSGRWFTQAG